MTSDPQPFVHQFKALVDRICDRDGILRQDLADDLGVHLTSVSGTALRGGVSFSLIEKIAKRAQATPQELSDLELAWLHMRRERIALRDEKYRRAIEVLTIVLDALVTTEEWIEEQGLGPVYSKLMRGKGRDLLLKRAKEALKKPETESQMQ